MARPKKDTKPLKFTDKAEGQERRSNYYKEILEKAPVFPKPLEFEDIDNSVKEFVSNVIDLSYEGVELPTFSLYSNQRFSEYSQTWEHTDDKGNLLMNFKTVMREKVPKTGSSHGVKYNIPGERKYTLLIRDVLNDNGTEHYEIYSMKQPYTVDLQYKVGFITNKFELINQFSQKISKIFSARQYYIRPNGHFIPMVLEGISDESEYSIEARKFYSISCEIKVMAYIIHQDDFVKEIKPKRVKLAINDNKKNKVEIEEFDTESLYKQGVEINISFRPFESKTIFIMDTDVDIDKISTSNVRNFKLWINSTPFYTDNGVKIKENDEVRISIVPYELYKESIITLKGKKDVLVSDEQVNSESVKDSIPNVDKIEVI